MKLNGIEYDVNNAVIDTRAGKITLFDSDGGLTAFNRSKESEIEEIEEITTTEKYIDEEIQTDEDGIDFVAKVVRTREVTTTKKTGQMIPNPQYFEPTSLEEIEDRLIDNHGFTRTESKGLEKKSKTDSK